MPRGVPSPRWDQQRRQTLVCWRPDPGRRGQEGAGGRWRASPEGDDGRRWSEDERLREGEGGHEQRYLERMQAFGEVGGGEGTFS